MELLSLGNYDVGISSFKAEDIHIAANKRMLADIGVERMWPITKGQGIKIGVIDTGIDVDHPALKANIKDGIYTAAMGAESLDSIQDSVGHGTHVAGLIAANGPIYGIAPEAHLYVVKAFRNNGQTSIKNIIKGVAWCIEKKVDIISMSLGAQVNDPQLHNAIKTAISKGIIVTAAAGNDAKGNRNKISIDYPASYRETLAVGAINERDVIANFSSVGNVDLVANGVDVASTYLKGSYTLLSGTSMATPQIAGAQALIQSMALRKFGTKLSMPQIKVHMAMLSRDLGKPGKDSNYGYGEFKF